jgi:chromosomal replication initiation ATPase DnaA
MSSLSHPRTHGGFRPRSGGRTRIQKIGPPIEDILNDVCDALGQPVDAIKSHKKKEELVVCRCIFAYVCCHITDVTFYKIGDLINRDHTSVMYQRANAIDWMSANDQLFMEAWATYTEKSAIWNQYISSNNHL